MIKLSDNWYLKSDKNQWILVESYIGKDKNDNIKRHSRESYHSTIKQVSSHLVNQEAKAAVLVGDIKLIMDFAMKDIAMNLNAINKKEFTK